MISTYDVREIYTGANNLADYTFDFKITALTQLRIVIYETTTGALLLDSDGEDTTFVDSVDFDAVDGAGTVHLLANLATGRKLYLILANVEPTQPFEFKNKSDFTLSRIMYALDFIVMQTQSLAYLASSAFLPSDSDVNAGFNPRYPPGLFGAELKIPHTNDDGDGWADPSSWTALSDLGTAVTAAADAIAAALAAAASQAAAAVSAAAAAASAVAAAVSAGSVAGDAAAATASAAAALVSETNAAVSETNAADSEAAAATSEGNSATSEGNAANSEAAAAVSETNAAASAASAAASASIVGPFVTASRGSPTLLAASGIIATGNHRVHYQFIAGNAAPVASVTIAAGTQVGDMLYLQSRSGTNTVTVADGAGTSQNGSIIFGLDTTVAYVWDGTNWCEMGFRRQD